MNAGEAQTALVEAENIDLNTLTDGLPGLQCVAVVVGGEVILLNQEEAASQAE
jgi:hypothetical protein